MINKEYAEAPKKCLLYRTNVMKRQKFYVLVKYTVLWVQVFPALVLLYVYCNSKRLVLWQSTHIFMVYFTLGII